jgi:hypothetical protein
VPLRDIVGAICRVEREPRREGHVAETIAGWNDRHLDRAVAGPRIKPLADFSSRCLAADLSSLSSRHRAPAVDSQMRFQRTALLSRKTFYSVA